jgi:diguanylate cyclase (GGDEF)-like protein
MRMDHKIVVVDDDPGTIQLIGRILQGISELTFATSGEKALQLIQESAPDLILLDAELPGMSGFKVFDALKALPDLIGVPIIFITSHNEAGFEVSALNMGAADFIAKPFTSARLLARVKTQLRNKRALDELRRVGGIDTLTGVGGRRQFDECLDREWRRGLRVGDPMSLLLIDVDHFGLYGERYGHQNADYCLRRAAQAIAGIARRPADFLSRCGGEQFGLVLPQTPRGGAEHIALRILDAIESLKIRHETSPTSQHVTASIGVSCYDEQSACWARPSANSRSSGDMRMPLVANDLVLAADKALSSARNSGYTHARLLDVADLETRIDCRDIAPSAREAHCAQWA